jgi:hypothetical protein
VNDFAADGTRVLVRSIAQGVALAMGRRMFGPSYAGPYGNHHAPLFASPAFPAEDKPTPDLLGKKEPAPAPLLSLVHMGGVCPECGNLLEYVEGCLVCRTCGYSRCT